MGISNNANVKGGHMDFCKCLVKLRTVLPLSLALLVKPCLADDSVGVTCYYNYDNSNDVAYHLLEFGGLWRYTTAEGGFDYITDLEVVGFVDLDAYYNAAQEHAIAYGVTDDGDVIKYSTEEGVEYIGDYGSTEFTATAVYYNTELNQAVLYSVTSDGDLYKYATGDGFEYIGNFGTDLIVGLTVYYNYSLSQAVVYAVASNGDLRKYATGEGFEDPDDYYDPIVDVATYYNANSAEAIVYGVTSGGQLWKYSTSTGFIEIGNFGTAGVVGLATYYNESNEHAVVYTINHTGSLYMYSTDDGFNGNVAAVSEQVAIPKFQLNRNYPNPFNPSTTIEYTLHYPQDVQLNIFDVLGNPISTLVEEPQNAGTYDVRFYGSGLASGVYICQLVSGNQSTTKRMLLIK